MTKIQGSYCARSNATRRGNLWETFSGFLPKSGSVYWKKARLEVGRGGG